MLDLFIHADTYMLQPNHFFLFRLAPIFAAVKDDTGI